MSPLISVMYFLFSLIFDLTIFLLWARITLRYLKVSRLHPLNYLVDTLTAPLIQPIEQFLYSGKRPLTQYDWVSFFLIIGVEVAKFIILGFLAYGKLLSVPFLLLLTLGDFLIQPCNFLFYIILIRVIMSWVNPAWNNPAASIINLVTDPLLNLGRRIIPDISGFDFSPFVILILLKIIVLFIKASLPFHLI